jgi:hypothetical protein
MINKDNDTESVPVNKAKEYTPNKPVKSCSVRRANEGCLKIEEELSKIEKTLIKLIKNKSKQKKGGE